jgi:hypothetical protein
LVTIIIWQVGNNELEKEENGTIFDRMEASLEKTEEEEENSGELQPLSGGAEAVRRCGDGGRGGQ